MDGDEEMCEPWECEPSHTPEFFKNQAEAKQQNTLILCKGSISQKTPPGYH